MSGCTRGQRCAESCSLTYQKSQTRLNADRNKVCVYAGEALAHYSFGEDHPFGPLRYGAFYDEFLRRGLDKNTVTCRPVIAEQQAIERFHTRDYVEQVKAFSASGHGYLDNGDTPAFPGAYEAAATVVGSTLAALDEIMTGECRRAFVPIAGLHHARRDRAAGFCVFNDCGIVIETLLQQYGLHRIAYVDIDAHHGDGVLYAFNDNPAVFIIDVHEDGHTLYPGTGFANETGAGAATGTKLNIPMPMGADDAQLAEVWQQAEAFLRDVRPEIILMQCGADSLAGDPITHMAYTEQAHATVARQLCRIADEFCEGRLLAMGGGGYNLFNLAKAWCAVVEALL